MDFQEDLEEGKIQTLSVQPHFQTDIAYVTQAEKDILMISSQAVTSEGWYASSVASESSQQGEGTSEDQPIEMADESRGIVEP